jgi:hypothetical protein
MNKKYKFDRGEYIKFINENINKLLEDEMRGIGQILVNAGLWDKIVEKGRGSQIKYKDIPDDTLSAVYTYTKNKVDDKSDANEDNSDSEEEIVES